MKKPIHILIIPSWYPQKAGDIGGSFFREQALALSKKGHQVGVIAPAVVRSLKDISGIISKPYGLEVENDQGIKTYRWHRVNFTPRLDNVNRSKWLKIGERLFEKYVKDNGLPDILHIHSLVSAGLLGLIISKKYDIPYVVTEHSTAFARGVLKKDALEEFAEVIKSSRTSIAVSSEFRELLNITFNTNEWMYLPNIVSDYFFDTELNVSLNKQQFDFINICLLDKKKRVDILIKAFSKAFKGNKKIKLKIGGDGPEKDSLIELVHNENLSEQITFLGTLERGQVRNEVADADAFVLSSEYETFGVVIIEALALGKPVIATRCGGPESIIVPEVGYLVDKNSVDSLAQAMVRLYENRNKYSAEAIREYCYINFSEEAVINKLIDIYQSSLNKSIYDPE